MCRGSSLGRFVLSRRQTVQVNIVIVMLLQLSTPKPSESGMRVI
jgi:hypothetical protein